MTIHNITLGELLTSDNATIARHARGVLAELNKQAKRLAQEQDAALSCLKGHDWDNYGKCVNCGKHNY